MNAASIARSDTCDQPTPALAAYSVADFCAAHGITKVLLYSMLKAGTGPRIMKVGRRTLISIEAAADWRRQMENGAQVEPGRRKAAKFGGGSAPALPPSAPRDVRRAAKDPLCDRGQSSGIRG